MKTFIQKHFLFISAVVLLGVGIFWYLVSSPKPQAEEHDGVSELVTYKREEMLFIKADDICQQPFDDSGQINSACSQKETIVLEGQVEFRPDGGEGGYFVPDTTLQGSSILLHTNLSLKLRGNLSLNLQSKFNGLDFPSDAVFEKQLQFLQPRWLLAYSNESPENYIPFTDTMFSKREEGVIKRFPPFWDNPLCWIADPNSSDQDKQPIAVYQMSDLGSPIGWIIKNCDQFWPEEYYGSGTTPPQTVSFPTESSEHAVISKVELQFVNEQDTVVLQGPTVIRTAPGKTEGTIDTEMLAMDLTGGGMTLKSDPNQPSIGRAERTFTYPLDFPADSFFDVFFDITIPSLINHDGGIINGDFGLNGEPTTTIQTLKPYSLIDESWQPGVRLTSRIKQIPWWWSTYCSNDQIYLYSEEQIADDGNFYPGESEPVRVISNFCQEIIPFDFGDAPDLPYPTLLERNGARHLMFSTYSGFPRLGDLIDAEPDGLTSADARGDNFFDINDEDGVEFNGSSFTLGGSLSGTVLVNNIGDNTSFLNAWVDFNADGYWNNEEEHIIDDQIINDEEVPTGNFNFNVAIPEITKFGFTFARFRISSEEELSYDGEAPDGEVEDYRIKFLPALEEGFSSSIDEDGNLDVFKGEDLITKLPPGTVITGLVVDAEPGKAFVSGVRLPVDQTKELKVRIKDSTDYICVIDAEVTSLTELSTSAEDCRGTIISCPGESGDYTCEVDEPYYIVSGLSNSGISEVTPPAPPAPPSTPAPAGGAVPLFILQQQSQQQQLQQQLEQEFTPPPTPPTAFATPQVTQRTAKIGKGSVWGIARSMLSGTATTYELIQLTKRILLLNNVCEPSWKMTGCKYNSRRLPYGFQFILP